VMTVCAGNDTTAPKRATAHRLHRARARCGDGDDVVREVTGGK